MTDTSLSSPLSAPLSDLPIIDFQNMDRDTIDIIDRQCRACGFFYLANHGIETQIAAAFAAAQAFFALPDNVKQEIAIEHSPCHRGWFQIGGEALDGRAHPEGDYKEGIKIGRDCGATHPRVKAGVALHGPNQYAALDGWREAMDECYSACEDVSRALMAALAQALSLPPDYFNQYLHEPMATLAPLHYPPLPNDKIISAGAHTDFGCLTLLAQQDIGGLQICDAQNNWVDVPPHPIGYTPTGYTPTGYVGPNMLVVNIGDMMQKWTGGHYRSLRHRVINRAINPSVNPSVNPPVNQSGHHRYSLAYFFDPDPDADLSPLPGCAPPNYKAADSLKETSLKEKTGNTCLDHLLHKIDESFAYRTQNNSEINDGNK